MTKEKIRTKICEIISRMLDNPDEYEIYPTGRCYEELMQFSQDILDKQKEEIGKLMRKTLSIETLKQKKEFDKFYNKLDNI